MKQKIHNNQVMTENKCNVFSSQKRFEMYQFQPPLHPKRKESASATYSSGCSMTAKKSF